MPLGRPIGRSNGRGGSPTSPVGCCRDQHSRDQKPVPLSPAAAAVDSPCQPLKDWARSPASRRHAMDQRHLFKQAHGPAGWAAHRQGHCQGHPLMQIYPEICTPGQQATGEMAGDRAVSKPVICSPICSHAPRSIPEKSIGATGFEPAT